MASKEHPADTFALTEVALGECEGSVASIPLRYLARHGIIAGSTGTGKSRAMQVLAEQLSDSGISVFVSDVKGDASGFCVPCAETEVPDEHPAWPADVAERNRLAPFKPHSLKAAYWSVGARFSSLRFSLSEAGSVLLSRMLFLNPTQESILAIAFSYARKFGRQMDNIGELQDILDEMVQTGQRGISPSSVSVIQRKLMALEDSGLARLFGRPSLQISDLKGLNVLNLSDARRDMSAPIAPAFLLNKLFNELPEVGDAGRPGMVIFFDEAHYLFKDSNKSLRDLMVTILKQIRSKGVSVFFVTQDASDLPEEILAQLSTKIIFSQKTLTEKGNSRLRALAKSFPGSDEGMVETLKSLPPGTAILSTLDKSGNQTPPARVKVFAPGTTMAVVPDDVLRKATDAKLIAKYAEQKTAPKKVPPAISQQAVPLFASRPAQTTNPQKVTAAREAIAEKKEKGKKQGPSIWDWVFGFLLKLVDFTLKALGKVAHALIIRPMQGMAKWLFKKPIRLIYLLLALLAIYVVFVNWPLVSSFLAALKIK